MINRGLILKYAIFLNFFVKGEVAGNNFLKISVDVHKDITLSCHNQASSNITRWEFPGMKKGKPVLINGDLFINDVQKKDSGEYTCSTEDDKILSKYRLSVNTPPAALSNVTVIPSTVHALIQWILEDDGGYPITRITVRYKEQNGNDSWHYTNSHQTSPTATQIDIYKLNPNSTYLFQIWATNKLGSGEVTNVTAKTLHDSQEIELARHLLEGAETFDTRAWLAAVAIVMSTLIILTVGTCCVLYRDWHLSLRSQLQDDPERIELIPNVILNPGYYEDVVWSKRSEDNLDEDDDVTMYFACRNGARAIRV